MIEIIKLALPEIELRLRRELVDEIAREAEGAAGPADPEAMLRFRGMVRQRVEQIRDLIALGERQRSERQRLEVRMGGLAEAVARVATPLDRAALVLEFLAEAVPGDADRDYDAVHRGDLDIDAAEERGEQRIERYHQKEEIIVKSVGELVARMIGALKKDEEITEADVVAIFEATRLAPFLQAAIRDSRVSTARSGLVALGALVKVLPPGLRPLVLGKETAELVREKALDARSGAWIQGTAATLALELAPEFAARLAERVTAKDRALVEPVVRAAFVRHVASTPHPENFVTDLRRIFESGEPSELVRMAAARALAAVPGPRADTLLVEISVGGPACDRSPRVRAEAVAAWSRRGIERPDRERAACRLLSWVIAHDPSPVVRRVAAEEAERFAAARQKRLKKFKIDPLDKLLIDSLGRAVAPETEPSLRQTAEDAREAICVRNLPAFEWTIEQVVERLRDSPAGGLDLRRTEFKVPEDQLGRILAFATRDDLGIYIDVDATHYHFRRGEASGFRLWRLLHEITRPAPGKTHGSGRMSAPAPRGDIRVPPGGLAEAGEPGVPGARRLIEGGSGWRRWLPSVDDALDVLRPFGPDRVRIFSSQGETVVKRAGAGSSVRRWLRLTLAYAELDELRSSPPTGAAQDPAIRYVRRLDTEFGVLIEFRPYRYRFNRSEQLLDSPVISAILSDGKAPAPPPEPTPAEADALDTETPVHLLGHSGSVLGGDLVKSSTSYMEARGLEAFPPPIGAEDARALIARILHGREAQAAAAAAAEAGQEAGEELAETGAAFQARPLEDATAEFGVSVEQAIAAARASMPEDATPVRDLPEGDHGSEELTRSETPGRARKPPAGDETEEARLDRPEAVPPRARAARGRAKAPLDDTALEIPQDTAAEMPVPASALPRPAPKPAAVPEAPAPAAVRDETSEEVAVPLPARGSLGDDTLGIGDEAGPREIPSTATDLDATQDEIAPPAGLLARGDSSRGARMLAQRAGAHEGALDEEQDETADAAETGTAEEPAVEETDVRDETVGEELATTDGDIRSKDDTMACEPPELEAGTFLGPPPARPKRKAAREPVGEARPSRPREARPGETAEAEVAGVRPSLAETPVDGVPAPGAPLRRGPAASKASDETPADGLLPVAGPTPAGAAARAPEPPQDETAAQGTPEAPRILQETVTEFPPEARAALRDVLRSEPPRSLDETAAELPADASGSPGEAPRDETRSEGAKALDETAIEEPGAAPFDSLTAGRSEPPRVLEETATAFGEEAEAALREVLAGEAASLDETATAFGEEAEAALRQALAGEAGVQDDTTRAFDEEAEAALRQALAGEAGVQDDTTRAFDEGAEAALREALAGEAGVQDDTTRAFDEGAEAALRQAIAGEAGLQHDTATAFGGEARAARREALEAEAPAEAVGGAPDEPRDHEFALEEDLPSPPADADEDLTPEIAAGTVLGGGVEPPEAPVEPGSVREPPRFPEVEIPDEHEEHPSGGPPERPGALEGTGALRLEAWRRERHRRPPEAPAEEVGPIAVGGPLLPGPPPGEEPLGSTVPSGDTPTFGIPAPPAPAPPPRARKASQRPKAAGGPPGEGASRGGKVRAGLAPEAPPPPAAEPPRPPPPPEGHGSPVPPTAPGRESGPPGGRRGRAKAQAPQPTRGGAAGDAIARMRKAIAALSETPASIAPVERAVDEVKRQAHEAPLGAREREEARRAAEALREYEPIHGSVIARMARALEEAAGAPPPAPPPAR